MTMVATYLKRSGREDLAMTFSIVASGNYVANGDPVDFAVAGGFTNRQPDFVTIVGKAGFVYQYDFANKKVFVYTNTAGAANAPLGEHTAAAYAAGVTGDTIRAKVEWLATPGLT